LFPHDDRPAGAYIRFSIRARNGGVPGRNCAEFCDFSGVAVSITKGGPALAAEGTAFRPEMTSMASATLSSIGTAGWPLAEKLGYCAGATIAFVALPETLADLPGSVDFAKVARRQDWLRPMGNVPFDVIHAFTRSRAELVAGLPRLRRALRPDGMIWVSWPKSASRVPTDVSEEIVRAEALKHDLVDVKVAAIDQVWSGLKLVIRVDRR
jgi:hypothetical protein